MFFDVIHSYSVHCSGLPSTSYIFPKPLGKGTSLDNVASLLSSNPSSKSFSPKRLSGQPFSKEKEECLADLEW